MRRPLPVSSFFLFSLSLIYFLCAFHCRFRHSAKAALSLYFPLTIATYLSLLSKKKKQKATIFILLPKGPGLIMQCTASDMACKLLEGACIQRNTKDL